MKPLHSILLIAGLSLTASRADGQCVGETRRLVGERQYDEARAAAQAQLARNARDADAIVCLGQIALGQGRSGEAVDWFEKAVKLNDASSSYHLWLGNALGEEAQKASKFRQPFLARRVKTEFESAVRLDPANLDARHGLIQFYSMAPGFMGGNMDRAREQAAAVARMSPMRGHWESGMLYEREKDVAAAEREYQAAVGAAPDSTTGYYALANLHARQQRWPDAFAAVERLMKARPDEASAHLSYGRLAAISGQNLERGEREIRTWLANPPKTATSLTISNAHTRLGDIYTKQGRQDLARASYQEALKVNPKNGDARKALNGN